VQLPLFPERVTLTRIQPALNERRYYQIEVQADLFGTVVLARRWGRIGRSCRMRLEPYPDFGSALNALASLARRKRQRGYQDQHAT
jgi:predicted DNA-binding WGR domain protein